MRLSFALACSILVSGALSGAQRDEIPRFENATPGVRYVGSTICAGCHNGIYRSFLKTDMGRSASPIDERQRNLVANPVRVDNPSLHRFFNVFRQGDEVFQSETGLDGEGMESFRETRKLAYAIGANENAYTYLVRQGPMLLEAPLSFYRKLNGWDMSPGYEKADSGFSRPAAPGCLVCHTGRSLPVPGPDGTYEDPPFREVAIGCENCHGPGELHVAQRSAMHPVSQPYDPAIVNPAKLPGWLANNICMSCHEVGSARVIHDGRSPLDYRPGTPLDRVVSIFALARQPNGDPSKTQVVTHFQGMIASQCYRSSAGNLKCITCHDPHVQPGEAVSYYKQKCLTCHRESSCSLPVAQRRGTSPPDNCLQCHMARKAIATIPHSALTDHRIVKTYDEPFPPPPDDPFTSSTGLLHLSAVPGETPDDLTAAQAYTLIDSSDPKIEARWLELLRAAREQHPDDAWVLAQVGTYLLSLDNPALAAEGRDDLRRSVAGGTNLPGVYETLGRSLAESGDTQAAIEVLGKGIKLDPYRPATWRLLIAIYGQRQDGSRQIETAKKYLELFPQDDKVRSMFPSLRAQARPAAQ